MALSTATSVVLLAVITAVFVGSSDSEDNVGTACVRWYDVPPSKLSIKCPPGQIVSVTKAFYGYWKNNYEGYCSYTRDDCTEDAMHVAVTHCRGKTACAIPTETPLLAHILSTALDVQRECATWNDRHDYLQVYYRCEHVPDNYTFVASDCTHFYTVNEEPPHPVMSRIVEPLRNSLEIACPADKVIRVKEAFYGWWKDNLDRGCRFHEEDCKVATRDADACNDKTTCRVTVRRSGNSPRCGQPFFQLRVDHFDYIEVKYQCRTEK